MKIMSIFTVLCSSLLSKNLDERVRAFNSISKETMDEIEHDISGLFTDDYVKTLTGLSCMNTSVEDVRKREDSFNEMTNIFDDRMINLRLMLFLL
jgi:hypothetical protein